MTSEPIRVLLADDHPIVRVGLRTLLEAEPDIHVVGEAGTADEAVELARELQPDVAVLDISMPGNGLEALRRIAALGLPTRILILTVHAEERYLLPVLQAGGSGYVRKSSLHTDLVEAIRTVARGEVFIDQAAARTLLQGYLDRARTGEVQDPAQLLSEREREVLRLTAAGYTAQEIADQLFLSPKTVETYRHRVMQKLGFSRRSELVRFALRIGLLDPQTE
ncbi:response regulator transcription factor [Thermomicrobium sp. CFH 73360]|uniref:response regulator n=1 Tax=Thermomicrobium sp. CFH 73360 TaxID=2951987 RepID=UPI0020770F8E|nr:response regulator transcription factor [Thermomicrobium sp. CFH 73360]MCM8746148.1 response regulator transcription factor [Thermomicrobium sp. CFH 73360]